MDKESTPRIRHAPNALRNPWKKIPRGLEALLLRGGLHALPAREGPGEGLGQAAQASRARSRSRRSRRTGIRLLSIKNTPYS